MYNTVGEAQIGVNFYFIAKALTEQGQEEETISTTQFFKIKSFEFNEDMNLIIFDCDVFEHSVN